MLRGLTFTALMLPLSACVAAGVYHAAGVSVGQRDADLARCESVALQQYPVLNETRFRPPTFVPPTEICDAGGVCTRTAGYFEPGDSYVVDINRDFRRNAQRGCMGAAGYSRIDLPFCEPGTAVVQSTTMPGLTGGTCLLRRGAGEPLIVNPAR